MEYSVVLFMLLDYCALTGLVSVAGFVGWIRVIASDRVPFGLRRKTGRGNDSSSNGSKCNVCAANRACPTSMEEGLHPTSERTICSRQVTHARCEVTFWLLLDAHGSIINTRA